MEGAVFLFEFYPHRVMRSKLRAYDAQFANEWSKLINQTTKKTNKLVINSQLNSQKIANSHKNRFAGPTATNRQFNSHHAFQSNRDSVYGILLFNSYSRIIDFWLFFLRVKAFGNTADDFLDVNFFKCASDKNHPNQKCM